MLNRRISHLLSTKGRKEDGKHFKHSYFVFNKLIEDKIKEKEQENFSL